MTPKRTCSTRRTAPAQPQEDSTQPDPAPAAPTARSRRAAPQAAPTAATPPPAAPRPRRDVPQAPLQGDELLQRSVGENEGLLDTESDGNVAASGRLGARAETGNKDAENSGNMPADEVERMV